jgi:hypothetical protein
MVQHGTTWSNTPFYWDTDRNESKLALTLQFKCPITPNQWQQQIAWQAVSWMTVEDYCMYVTISWMCRPIDDLYLLDQELWEVINHPLAVP